MAHMRPACFALLKRAEHVAPDCFCVLRKLASSVLSTLLSIPGLPRCCELNVTGRHVQDTKMCNTKKYNLQHCVRVVPTSMTPTTITLKRLALRGWRARLEASYTLEEKLHLVFRKVRFTCQRMRGLVFRKVGSVSAVNVRRMLRSIHKATESIIRLQHFLHKIHEATEINVRAVILSDVFALQEAGKACSNMLGNTQRDAWEAWREYMGSRRIQHDMAYRAAYFWLGSQLRAAFEKLRSEGKSLLHDSYREQPHDCCAREAQGKDNALRPVC
eukprot:1150391-Pelagomonas_calceolata.AAC.3